MLAAWGDTTPHANYQIAAFLRDVRACASPALAPLPAELERLAADVHTLAGWQASTRRAADAMDTDDSADLYYRAWRWLGERSPWMSYLVQCPQFYFVRIGDEIGYDNRDRVIDGMKIWTAQIGAHRMAVDAFAAAVIEVSDGLLDAMGARIDDLEHGRASPQTPVDVASLRAQHVTWQRELSESLEPTLPDVAWDETLAALATLGAKL